jgi:hypothetical protein
VLRVTPTGTLRLTIPRRASIAGGLAFAERQHDWIVREWGRLEHRASAWDTDTEILFRGVHVRLQVDGRRVVFAGEVAALAADANVRRSVERRLREIATSELPRRTTALALSRHLTPPLVSVRNQRSRWGSCSTRGSITLNWRLIQMSPEVSDYIIFHELAHRRQPNHSVRFWREVEALCPWWRTAEQWLRKHGKDLL